MRDISAALQAHLDTGVTSLAWCWKIICQDGSIYGFTDHDQCMQFDGIEWIPDHGLAPGLLQSESGFATASAGQAGWVLDGPFSKDELLAGKFDQARIEVWRVNWQDTSQKMAMWAGELGEVHLQNGRVEVDLVSNMRKLDHPVGRVFSRSCDAELGDECCGVDMGQPAYQVESTIVSVLDGQTLLLDGLVQFADGWFENGLVVWIDPVRDFQPIRIARHDRRDGGEWLQLQHAPRLAAMAGDRIRLMAGCDKTLAQCRVRFDNVVNFRGCPFMPGNDVLMSIPYQTK